MSRSPINWGDLRRTTPFTRSFGFDRGQPVDRYYIERFLQAHARDIQGRVLEIGDSHYTERFGGERVKHAGIFDRPGNDQATFSGDLGAASGLPDATFDCFINTQTLLFIRDLERAAHNIHAALKPGGVLLLTVPGISQILREDMDREGDYWRFTTRSIREVFATAFAPGDINVEAHGNVLTSVAFLHGLATEDLSPAEMDAHDPDYEMLIALRAVRRSR